MSEVSQDTPEQRGNLESKQGQTGGDCLEDEEGSGDLENKIVLQNNTAENAAEILQRCGSSSNIRENETDVGFDVIRPGTESSAQLDKQVHDVQGRDPVFIVQSSDGVAIEDFDEEIVSQLHKLLAGPDSETSTVIIINPDHDVESEVNGRELTKTKALSGTTESIHTSEDSGGVYSSCNVLNSTPSTLPSAATSSSPLVSVTTSVTTTEPLVNSFEQSASPAPSTTTTAKTGLPSSDNDLHSHIDLNDINIVCTESNTSSSINTSKSNELASVKAPNTADVVLSPKNLSSSHPSSSHADTDGDQTAEQPSFRLATNHQVSTASSASVTSSQVAEQLIHIAKKMIAEGPHMSQKVSIDESEGKIVISSPDLKISGEKSSSDSIITMYLSSPDELKTKLQNLKTNSPVIVMHAGDDRSSSESEEQRENPLHEVEKTMSANSDPHNSTNAGESGVPLSKTDSILATLSSAPTSGVVYQCSECDYSSHNKHYYKQHVDLVHKEERPYKCPHCDYAGKRRYALLEHMVVHSNHRPYCCGHCNASFRKKGHLTNHVKLHMSHRLVHCGVCNIQLPDAEAFESHLRKIHNTDKLYKCRLCDHTVVERRAMVTHLATHKEAVFSCTQCQECFDTESRLIEHVSLVHNIKVSNSRISAVNSASVSAPSPSLCPSPGDGGSKLVVESGVGNERVVHASNTSSAVAGSSLSTAKPDQVKGQVSPTPTPNIVCSECGFICSDTQLMKKHMWIHIDSSQGSAIQIKEQASKSTSNVTGNNVPVTSSSGVNSTSTNDSSGSGSTHGSGGSAMGLLKMNVVSGLKSLPENVVYQCTSCKFTSSDNSVFIKHMLQHKTQRNQLATPAKTAVAVANPASSTTTSTLVSDASGKIHRGLNIGLSSSHHLQNLTSNGQSPAVTSASMPVLDKIAKDGRLDSAVPFVFDTVSGRYRCLICGYHCDFQRTIKAHIWKHSGNQNIEYPVFESVKKVQSASNTSVQQQSPAFDHKTVTDLLGHRLTKASAPFNSNTETAALVQTAPTHPSTVPGTQVNTASSSKLIQFLPFNASDATPDVSTETEKEESRVQTVTGNHSVSSPNATNYDTKPSSMDTAVVSSTNSDFEGSQLSPLTIAMDEVTVTVEVETEKENIESSSVGEMAADTELKEVSVKEVSVKEEPSVVVEVVDSIPPSLGLTGMKSQQGSPRVSDCETSGSDSKLRQALQMAREVGGSGTEEEKDGRKGKYNLRRPKETGVSSVSDLLVKTSSRLKRLSGSNSQSAVGGDTKVGSDRLSVDEGPESKRVKTERMKTERMKTERMKTEQSRMDEAELSIDVKAEPSHDESDGTASSDETTSAGESSSTSAPPKAGICSSLLAVIEQLRERSRSDSERDLSSTLTLENELPAKRSGKRGRKSGAGTESVSVLQLHNIERISEASGEKFRCSLCHYTSQRICNMKIHMKTHRQKKPSECSLCDFASASPGLLQEHMLQHCKVRTYACKFCPQSFNHKSTLRAHMRAHKHLESFLCAYCVFETTNAAEYREHMLVHSGCSSRLRCPGCDHIMNSKEELTPHLMTCKGKWSQLTKSATDNNDTENSSQDISSPSITSLSQKQHDTEDALSSQQDQGSTVMTSQASPQPTRHACVVSGCSFSSSSLKELQDHLSVHCNPSLMVCDLCDFKALHSRSLKSHMKRHANDQRYVQQPLEQYKCNLCGYVCHHLPSLKSHMWRHASDQSYSYEFTNDVINAAIDHDSRIDSDDSQTDDPELLVRVINSERRIMEGELTNLGKGDGQRPSCWVTFRCCCCGFETINKAKLNIHMRSHSELIHTALEATNNAAAPPHITPCARKPGHDKSNHLATGSGGTLQPLAVKSENRRSPSTEENNEPIVPPKIRKAK